MGIRVSQGAFLTRKKDKVWIKHTFIMLLQQWKQFTEEQIRSVYPLEQVEITFAYPGIKEGYINLEDSNDPELYFVGTSRLPAHVDSDFPEFSNHLILVNTGLIAKGIDQDLSEKPQTPGTIIVLNAWNYHHVVDDKRAGDSKDPIWVSVCFDSVEEFSQEQVIKYFEEFLKGEKELYH